MPKICAFDRCSAEEPFSPELIKVLFELARSSREGGVQCAPENFAEVSTQLRSESMQVLHESNLTTELIKGAITHEICRGTRTPLPLFTVTLLNMSVQHHHLIYAWGFPAKSSFCRRHVCMAPNQNHDTVHTASLFLYFRPWRSS